MNDTFHRLLELASQNLKVYFALIPQNKNNIIKVIFYLKIRREKFNF